MLVLGVDPGSAVTGYGLVENVAGQLRYRHDEQLKLPAKADPGAKLALLFDHTTALLQQYKPDQLAVEGVFYGVNVKSMLTLGQARGAVMVAGAKFGISMNEYPPALVKQAVVGYGKATKDQIQHMVKLLLKVPEISGEHAADALAIAICHHHQVRLQGWQRG
ncbi:MAG: crossover junction endodeoxyribonuclease RuvC [Deltaproteobacteria bacterium]|nr:crossover junction endodeoxyribonuclease RuvC [Deltaproteobacteria bacterium]